MIGDGGLTFQEFITHEALPLSEIHEAILEFLRDREDAAVFGAQAVNAYADEPRMTQEVDILAMGAANLSEALRSHLSDRFRIAVRVRVLEESGAYRIFQVHRPTKRHLDDIRGVETLPPTERIEGILVLSPVALIAEKVRAYARRKGSPKSWTDRRDIALLLLRFPELKKGVAPVRDRLISLGADDRTLEAWAEIAAEAILEERDDY